MFDRSVEIVVDRTVVERSLAHAASQEALVNRLKLRPAAVSLLAVLTAAVATLAVATSPANAVTSSRGTGPILAATYQAVSPAATCDPKLDFEYGEQGVGLVGWTNVCGEGTFFIDTTEYYLWAIRMPTTPYHRVWFHQNSDGTGQAVCFYSQNQDIYLKNYVGTYPWIYYPGNVQVAANTSPC